MESATNSEVATSNGSEVGAVGRKYRYLTLKSRSHKKFSISLYIMCYVHLPSLKLLRSTV